MADDSELDYLKGFIQYACFDSTVKHFSEVKKISTISDTRRILIYPGELIGVDGKFYKKRFKVKISETSEAALTETFNNLLSGIDDLNKGIIGSSIGYTSIHFDTNSEDTTPSGITWDGTFFWILGDQNNRVYKYTAAGVYTGTSYDISNEETLPSGVHWDGTFFWITGVISEKVHKYDSSWTYTGISFEIGSEVGGGGNGITFDGSYFWVVGVIGDRLYKYTAAGVYTGDTIDISNETEWARGVYWDGKSFWVVESTNKAVYKYASDGSYTGFSIDTSSEATLPYGVVIPDKFLWVICQDTDEAYKYSYYLKPDTLLYIIIVYGNKAFENPKTKRWYQDVYIDVEWSTE